MTLDDVYGEGSSCSSIVADHGVENFSDSEGNRALELQNSGRIGQKNWRKSGNIL